MEFGNMEEGVKSDNHLTSAVAFVEGGIQEACDDTCSICLEAFCESDPSTVTCCKHEFHLQCILEWCQRSSQCPMCWQPISLKDPSSQELLDAIEQEKDFRTNPHRNTTIFHHPTLGDFELQHLPVGGTDAELEERIIQHLAAAAAMGRARNIARREGQRNRSSALGRPHYLVFSTHPNGPPIPPVSSSPIQSSENESASTVAVVEPTSLISVGEESTQIVPSPSSHADQISALASGSSVLASTHHETSSNNQRFPPPSSTDSHDKAGPSELQSFSETLKSRFNAMSTRYKESITKSTKGWKEKLFSRNTSNTNMTDLGSEVKGAGNSGISTVPGIIERHETRDNSRTNTDSGSSSLLETNSAAESNSLHYGSVPDLGNQQIPLTGGNNALDEGTQASGGTGSAAN